MNTFALVFLILCAIITVGITILTKRETNWAGDPVSDWRESIANGAKWGGYSLAVVLAIWVFVAFPYSTFERNSCKNEADGYGLDYDWSVRNGCRIELPTGQLVPDGKIRITSDGQITAGDD